MQPFVLLSDQRLDFGALPEDKLDHHKTGRFASARIFDARIAEGELVWMTVWDDEEELVEAQHQIKAIQEILGSGPRAQIQI